MIYRLCAAALLLMSLQGCALVFLGMVANAGGATHEHNTGFDREKPPAVDAANWVPVHN